MSDYLVRLRRRLHREPEIGLDLPRTQEAVLEALQGLPLDVTVGRATTSVTAVLRGTAAASGESPRSGKPVLLLRADMDALPVHETADVPYRSSIDGAMHACGHDLHMSMLVGAAHLLCARRQEISGDIVLMFQPGEESWHGAQLMIEEGVLAAAGRPVDAAMALHVFSGAFDKRAFFTRPGPMMAASDRMRVRVLGAGGHGATPHLAQDPVVAMAEMVVALQSVVTRQFDVFDPVVLTVGLLQAGTKANVIPGEAMFEATIRTFSGEARQQMRERCVRLVEGTAAAHGLDVDVTYIPGYPVTINDQTEAEFCLALADEMFDTQRSVSLANPLTGAEDFSLILQKVPGTFVGLGAVPDDVDAQRAPFNHSPDAVFDDDVLTDGAAFFAEWALRRGQGRVRPDSDPSTNGGYG